MKGPATASVLRRAVRAHALGGQARVFPASSHFRDARTGVLHRQHLHETVIQRAMAAAVRPARLAEPVPPLSPRHSSATELIRAGYAFAQSGNCSDTKTPAPYQCT